jgi:hypothetical protein
MRNIGHLAVGRGPGRLPHHQTSPRPRGAAAPQTLCEKSALNVLSSLRIGNENYNSYLVVGRFPAELGPEIRSNGSGSKNGAERTQN